MIETKYFCFVTQIASENIKVVFSNNINKNDDNNNNTTYHLKYITRVEKTHQ